MIHEIEIGRSTKNNWCRFIEAHRFKYLEETTKVLRIDFSNCNFLEPFHIVALACLIEEYHINGVKVDFVNCVNLEVKEYLANIKFFNYWDDAFDRNKYTNSLITTNLCLWKLNSAMITPYVLHAQEYYEKNFLNGKNAEPLNISLAEIFNNIIDHSNSEISGYCISQYYPNIHRMKMAICDFGDGIANVVNNYLIKNGHIPIRDDLAIIKALERSFSTKSTPKNKGFGLDIVKGIVLNCNGSIRVNSNYGVYQRDLRSQNNYLLRYPFYGTNIEIILDTKHFEEKEKDFLGEDFEF